MRISDWSSDVCSSDLERVGRADHRIGARIFGRDRREIHRDALMLGEQIKAALHRGEHAEREAVDLHDFTRVDIVLVPLDHLAILHGGGLAGYELVDPVTGHADAPCRFRVMCGCATEMTRAIESQTRT